MSVSRTRATRLAARSGMTLMELVVALVIVAMMAAAGVGTFQSIIDHRETVRNAAVATERASALHEMVRDWLVSGTIQYQAGGVPNLGGGRGATTAPASSSPTSASASSMNSQTNSAAQGNGDQVIFTTSAPTPAMQAGVRIRMYVDVDPNTPEKGLSIEYQTSQATPLVRKMLDSTVDSLVVEFLDRRTGRWFDASQASTIQPRAARVTLMAVQAKGVSRMLSLPIYVPIGNTQTLTGQALAAGQAGT